MPDKPHPLDLAGISRRDAFRKATLGMLGLAVLSDADLATAFEAPPAGDEAFIPDNNYPTFADEPAR